MKLLPILLLWGCASFTYSLIPISTREKHSRWVRIPLSIPFMTASLIVVLKDDVVIWARRPSGIKTVLIKVLVAQTVLVPLYFLSAEHLPGQDLLVLPASWAWAIFWIVVTIAVSTGKGD